MQSWRSRTPWMSLAASAYAIWQFKRLYDQLGGGAEASMTGFPDGVEAFCTGVGSVQGFGVFNNVGCGSDHVTDEPIAVQAAGNDPHWTNTGTRWAWYNVEDTFFDPEADPAFAYHWTVVGRWRVNQDPDWTGGPPPDLEIGFADVGAQQADDAVGPVIDPMLYPPYANQPTAPTPYRDIPKRRVNPHFPERDDRGPKPDVKPRPDEDPGKPPGVDIPTDPKPDTPVRPRPIEKRPPGKRVKERKTRVGAGAGYSAIRWALNFVTEGSDYINALYWALPKKLRAKNHDFTLTGKAKFLFRHLGEVDMRQGLTNLLKNALEDFAIGKLSQRAQRITKHPAWVRPLGPFSGPAG